MHSTLCVSLAGRGFAKEKKIVYYNKHLNSYVRRKSNTFTTTGEYSKTQFKHGGVILTRTHQSSGFSRYYYWFNPLFSLQALLCQRGFHGAKFLRSGILNY